VARLSLLQSVQTGSGAHPASYPIGTGDSFPGVKRPGREADYSLPTRADVKTTWIYTSTPLNSLSTGTTLPLYLRVFENRVLKTMFVPKRHDVIGRRKDEELHNFSPSPNGIRMISSWRNAYRAFAVKPEEKRSLG
jgi:hypothetical protein